MSSHSGNGETDPARPWFPAEYCPVYEAGVVQPLSFAESMPRRRRAVRPASNHVAGPSNSQDSDGWNNYGRARPQASDVEGGRLALRCDCWKSGYPRGVLGHTK